MSATQANPYRDYAIDYSHHANCKAESQGDLLAYHHAQQQQPQVRHDNKPGEVPYPTTAPQHGPFEHSQHQHASAGVVPGAAAPQATTLVHGLPQTVLLTPHHHHQMLPRHLASQYPSTSLDIHSAQRGAKRSHGETEPDGDHSGREIRPQFSGFSVEGPPEASHTPEMLFSTQPEQSSGHDFDPRTSMEMPPQHHHHRLPPHAAGQHHDMSLASPNFASGPPRVVGQPGMPDPAPRPRGPKLKFTPEEDGLLIELKENKNLTWKQIADFFPGRTSGTLQVRYCTKLKAKDVIWTDEMVQRLQRAMQEYENDRWRIIAGKVGNGFTPAACREKATQL